MADPKAPTEIIGWLDESSCPEPNSGCWLWLGPIQSRGYGMTRLNTMPILAHRLSWIMQNGYIPNGCLILHKCDTRLCVNPNHLFVGDSAENSKDMVHKGRSVRGELHHAARLNAENIKNIRADERTVARIARDYRVGYATIHDIKSRKTWGHLP